MQASVAEQGIHVLTEFGGVLVHVPVLVMQTFPPQSAFDSHSTHEPVSLQIFASAKCAQCVLSLQATHVPASHRGSAGFAHCSLVAQVTHWPSKGTKGVSQSTPQAVPSQVAMPLAGLSQGVQLEPQVATSVLETHCPLQLWKSVAHSQSPSSEQLPISPHSVSNWQLTHWPVFSLHKSPLAHPSTVQSPAGISGVLLLVPVSMPVSVEMLLRLFWLFSLLFRGVAGPLSSEQAATKSINPIHANFISFLGIQFTVARIG
jgi:hypothetical protein